MRTASHILFTGLLALSLGSARMASAAPPPSPGEPSSPASPDTTTPPAAESPDIPTAPPPAVPTAIPPDQTPSAHPDVAPAPFASAPTTTPPAEPVTETRPMWTHQVGAAVLVGGGVEDFTNTDLKNMTGVGGTWDARAVAGTRQFLGFEAAYVGSARNINALGLSSNAGLVSNGVEGALRVNLPLPAGRSLVEPFGFVGVGWQHYNVTNTNANTSDLADNDDVMTLPYGGGLEYAYGMFLADARFTFRQTYQNDLLRTTNGRLNNWGLSAQVGMQF